MIRCDGADVRVTQDEFDDGLVLRVGEGILSCSGLTVLREPSERIVAVEVPAPFDLVNFDIEAVILFHDAFRVDAEEVTCHVVRLAPDHHVILFRIFFPGTVFVRDPHHTDDSVTVDVLSLKTCLMLVIRTVHGSQGIGSGQICL